MSVDAIVIGAGFAGLYVVHRHAGGFGEYRTHLDEVASTEYAGLVLTTRSP